MNTGRQPFQLKAEHLSKSYGSLKVWEDVNLTFCSGSTYCLMGPSGWGKTTLLRILLGLEQADRGSVTFSPRPEAPLVAVFQEDRLCEEFSALDNVMLAAGRQLSRRQAFEELCLLLPEESIQRPVSTLSGGMKRRVAILRALLAPSCGILMDEPFTGLDEDTKRSVIRFIREKTAGKLLIVATHQEEDVGLLRGIKIGLGMMDGALDGHPAN